MSYLNNETVTQTTDAAVETDTKLANASTKDAGRVKIGGATISFKAFNIKDAGRVRVGGATIRFKSTSAGTKDMGRVKVGGATIRF